MQYGTPHLPAEGWKEHHQLNGVDIVGDHHQLSFLILDIVGHIIDSVTDNWGPKKTLILRSIFRLI